MIYQIVGQNIKGLNFGLYTMERLSVDNMSVGMGILARKSLSASSRKASQISLLNDSPAEHYHHIDDRNWSWSYLRVRKFNLFINVALLWAIYAEYNEQVIIIYGFLWLLYREASA